MFRRKAAKKKKVKHKKVGGLFFLSLTPLSLLVAVVSLVNLVLILTSVKIDTERWGLFAIGVVAAVTIVTTMKLHKFRTFIHELKHAVMVVLTGNRLRDFHVETHTGHVSYDIFNDKRHFAPLIVLAPYFYPILSIPVLIAGIILQPAHQEWILALLGYTLTADIIMGYQEIHSHQTDLKKIFGGFLIAGLFIVSFLFMWSVLCLLFVSTGREAYSFSWYNIIDFCKPFFEETILSLKSYF